MTQQQPLGPGQEARMVCPLTTSQIIDRIILFIEQLGNVKLYMYQALFSRRVIESVLLNDGATITGLWARQCVHEDTVILDRDGTACRIKDHPRAWCTGEKELFSVEASNGQFVRATADHPMLTRRGWVEVRDLREDDWLCAMAGWSRFGDGVVPYERETFVNRHRTDRECGAYRVTSKHAKMLGYLTADGYSFRALEVGQSIKFVNIREEYLAEFESLVADLFPDVKTTRYAKGRGFDVVCTSVNGSTYKANSLRRYLAAMEPDDGFPRAIFRADREAIQVFLNRMYSADGCAWGDTMRGAIDLACGGSEVYAQYAVSLLGRVGVQARVKEEVLNEKLFYRVQVADRRNIKRFMDTVGPVFGKEEACARLCGEYGTRWSNRAEDQAPPGDDGEDRVWVRLSAVKPWGVGEVWDVEYPDKGWFFAQGLAVHNCGKTETVATVADGLAVILPILAEEFPDDPRFQSFAGGYHIGVYAPIKDQADTTFARMRERVTTDAGRAVLEEVGVSVTTNRGDTLAFSNGSTILSRTASPESQIEGKTHHLVICEEAQKLLRTKVEKEIVPMLTSTRGTMIHIGTAWASRGGFHHTIQKNEEKHRSGGPRNHFQIPYDIVISEKRRMFQKTGNVKHLKYEEAVNDTIFRLGGTNGDEFKMNYMCLWQESRVIAVREDLFKRVALKDLEAQQRFTTRQVAGLDIAKLIDATVLTIMDVDIDNPIVNDSILPEADEDRQIYYRKTIIDWLELHGPFEGYAGQYRQLVDYLLQTSVKVLCIDATGIGDPVFERIQAMIGGSIECIPYKFSSMSKSNLFKYYLQEMNASRLYYAGGANTRERIEYRKFQSENLDLDKEDHGGYTICRAPEGGHDDYPCSAALACWAEKMMDSVIMPEISSSAPSGGGASRRGNHTSIPAGGGRPGGRYGKRW